MYEMPYKLAPAGYTLTGYVTMATQIAPVPQPGGAEIQVFPGILRKVRCLVPLLIPGRPPPDPG